MAEMRQAGDWRLEQEVGSGSFAKVWRATHVRTGQVAAVKEINMDKLNKKLQESLASEVAVLNRTKHSNIVCLLDLIRDNNRLFIVLEYCAGGDLGHYIKRYRQVSEGTARYFLQQLAEGLKELRRHNVIHRDLKPQNLLLSDSSSTPLLKIADFGFARSLAPAGLAETLCGSPLYMAPEILQFHKYDAKADLWSIGTILFELLVGKPPFNGANHMQLLRNIERNEARVPDHIATRLSAHCRGLLGRLLQRNPVERITFDEFFQHPFLLGGTGPSAGVPPPQSMSHAAPTAMTTALPPAMRQAVAAVAAAAADVTGKAAGSSMPRPNLHLACQQSNPSTSYSRPQLQPPQQGPQQQGPEHLPAVAVHPWQAPASVQQVSHQAPPRPVLVSQPATRHPLAADPPGGNEAVEGLSDSMEDDFVVVYNPAAPNRSSSNSSKASSGLVEPRAAAVLQGTAAAVAGTMTTAQPGVMQAAGPPWAAAGPSASPICGQHQHQHLQHTTSPDARAMQLCWTAHIDHQQQQPYTVPRVAVQMPCSTASRQGPPEPCWPWLVAATPDSIACSHSLHLQQTASQRLQLLVQVIRGCVMLLNRHEAGGNDTTLPVTQQSEHVSLMLLVLQLVQVLCLPHSPAFHQQEQQLCQEQGQQVDTGGLSSLLAAASQADLEQLMSGAVELIRLAKAVPCLSSSDDDGAGAAAAATDGLAHMTGSIMATALPDPFGVLYQHALDSCRGAAVEEVMGNWQASMTGYSLAADLLLFLSQEWPQLGPADPGLLPQERLAMHKLYTAVNNRLAATVAEAPSAVLY